VSVIQLHNTALFKFLPFLARSWWKLPISVSSSTPDEEKVEFIYTHDDYDEAEGVHDMKLRGDEF